MRALEVDIKKENKRKGRERERQTHTLTQLHVGLGPPVQRLEVVGVVPEDQCGQADGLVIVLQLEMTEALHAARKGEKRGKGLCSQP